MKLASQLILDMYFVAVGNGHCIRTSLEKKNIYDTYSFPLHLNKYFNQSADLKLLVFFIQREESNEYIPYNKNTMRTFKSWLDKSS